MTADLAASGHAELRMAQRNLSHDEVSFVRENGKKSYRAGVIVHFLGRRHFPHTADARQYDHLEGTTVLSCPHCMFVLTAYRNRSRGLKDHERKPKYNRAKQYCPRCGR